MVTGAIRKTGIHRKSSGMRRIVEYGAVYSDKCYFFWKNLLLPFSRQTSHEDGSSRRLRNVGTYILTSNRRWSSRYIAGCGIPSWYSGRHVYLINMVLFPCLCHLISTLVLRFILARRDRVLLTHLTRYLLLFSFLFLSFVRPLYSC